MKRERLSYQKGKGWSTDRFPSLDSEQTAIFVFAAPGFREDPLPFAALRNAYPRSVILGCSTAGEIHGDEVRDESLSVAICRFEGTFLRSARADLPQQGAFEAGERLGRALSPLENGQPLQGVLVFSDGLSVNGTELSAGLRSVLPAGVPVTGGLAGDGAAFKRTWLIGDSGPIGEKVIALGFYGASFRMGHGSQGGWDIFGPERRVTRSEKNVLFELDGRPALSLYKEYLGDLAAHLPASGLHFPLQIRDKDPNRGRLVRTILAVDEDRQAMIFAGDIPTGSYAQLMRANFDRLIDGALGAAASARRPASGQGLLSLAISCVGRRLVLGERIEEEVEATLEKLPPGSEQIGFYSYGEISPLVVGGPCELHNQTMTITTFWEDEA